MDNVIWADFPVCRDMEIVEVMNILEIGYRNRMSMFEGHSDPNLALEQLAARKSHKPTK